MFPVLVGIDESFQRLLDITHWVESVGQQDVAVVLQRNQSISWGLQAVDTLLLMFCVHEVLNFE